MSENKTIEPGSDYAHYALSMSAAECASELNALNRHLRSIPKNDHGERAEALACIMHIRARQFVLAARAATAEHVADLSIKAKLRRQREAYEASTQNNEQTRSSD